MCVIIVNFSYNTRKLLCKRGVGTQLFWYLTKSIILNTAVRYYGGFFHQSNWLKQSYYLSIKGLDYITRLINLFSPRWRCVLCAATVAKCRWFIPGRGGGFLRAIKIRSTSSLGWEIKAEFPRRKILRHGKVPLRYFKY
jgi:hypothetical protein